MRINYYRFPEGIDPHTRYKNGACHKAGHCDIDRESCRGCPVCEGGWSECEHFICTEAEDTVEGCSVTEAKRLLRKFGGSAWTDHCERAGSVFEVTDITLKGNNSRFKYNRQL